MPMKTTPGVTCRYVLRSSFDTGDKDTGWFRAKLLADYSVASGRDDKLNVEVLQRRHGYIA